MGAISGSRLADEMSSLFSAQFCDGAITTTVLTDHGSDTNVFSPKLLQDVLKSDKTIQVRNLSEPVKFHNVLLGARKLICSRDVRLDVQLRTRHGEQLMLRGIKGLVCDEPLTHAFIGRYVLAALGLDNRVMLAAARDRLGSVLDMPDLLEKNWVTNEACPELSGTGSIGSLLRERGYEWGSTYHSAAGAEPDRLEDSDVSVDLGEDSPEKLTEALKGLVEMGRANGLSDRGVVPYQIPADFRLRLEKSPPADVELMRVRLKEHCNPVKMKALPSRKASVFGDVC